MTSYKIYSRISALPLDNAYNRVHILNIRVYKRLEAKHIICFLSNIF